MPCYSKLESFRYEVDIVTNVPMLKLLGLAGFSGTKYTPTACQDQLLLLFVIVSNIAISSGLSRLSFIEPGAINRALFQRKVRTRTSELRLD